PDSPPAADDPADVAGRELPGSRTVTVRVCGAPATVRVRTIVRVASLGPPPLARTAATMPAAAAPSSAAAAATQAADRRRRRTSTRVVAAAGSGAEASEAARSWANASAVG